MEAEFQFSCLKSWVLKIYGVSYYSIMKVQRHSQRGTARDPRRIGVKVELAKCENYIRAKLRPEELRNFIIMQNSSRI